MLGVRKGVKLDHVLHELVFDDVLLALLRFFFVFAGTSLMAGTFAVSKLFFSGPQIGAMSMVALFTWIGYKHGLLYISGTIFF